MLKVLYSLAIALLVVFFVGFGISAFYPDLPDPPTEPTEVRAARTASNERVDNPSPHQRQLMREYDQDISAGIVGVFGYVEERQS